MSEVLHTASTAADAAMGPPQGAPTRSEIECWTDTINDLSTAAAAYGAAADDLETAADAHCQQLSAPGGTDWAGEAADAAQEAGYADRGVVYRAADHLRAMRKATYLGASNLSQARDRALDAIDEAEADDFEVGDDLSVTDTRRYTSQQVSLYAERMAKADEHHGYITMRAGILASEDAEVAAKQQAGAATLTDMIPQHWERHGKEAPGDTIVGDGASGADGSIAPVDYMTDKPPDSPLTPDAVGWSGEPPPGKVEGTGVWTIDRSRPQSSPVVPVGPQPGEGQVTPVEPAPFRQGGWTGPMSVGPSSPATGFDYQHNYRFRIAGTQQTNIVEMVQIGDSWYPATWNQYVYEVQDQNRVVGIGDLGAISEIPAPGTWQPITLAEIGVLSHKFPDNAFYIPDGCGGSMPMVDAAFPNQPPPVPVLQSGN